MENKIKEFKEFLDEQLTDYNELKESEQRIHIDDITEKAIKLFNNNELRYLFDEFYKWLDELKEEEYDKLSLTDKCEEFFFKIMKKAYQ